MNHSVVKRHVRPRLHIRHAAPRRATRLLGKNNISRNNGANIHVLTCDVVCRGVYVCTGPYPLAR